MQTVYPLLTVVKATRGTLACPLPFGYDNPAMEPAVSHEATPAVRDETAPPLASALVRAWRTGSGRRVAVLSSIRRAGGFN